MPKLACEVTKWVKKIPYSENGNSVLCTTKKGNKYIVSQNVEKQRYTLWKISDEGYSKLLTENSPYKLYDLIDWNN